MEVQKIEILFTGGRCAPEEILSGINSEYKIEFTIDPNEDKNYDETTICFLNPRIFGFTGNLEGYNKWVVDFLLSEYSYLTKYGLTDLELVFNVYYTDQCSFEVLDSTSLRKLSKYDISIPVNVFQVSQEEITSMLKGTFDEETYIDLF